MAFTFNKHDHEILATIAEHRVLTLSQVSAIRLKGRQVVRRRILAMEQSGLIASATRSFGAARGRPEKLLSLTAGGLDLLRSGAKDQAEMPDSRIALERINCLDHQVLVNWFRIHATHLEEAIPDLSVRFLSPSSPYVKTSKDRYPFISERVQVEGETAKSLSFIPDGVLSIAHKEKGKTLLFFLEADMGTEKVASLRRDPGDIRQKILNYQQYFRKSLYKRYEEIWECRLNGFRLLFITNSDVRLAALCKLAREMPPSDFIWLTTEGCMFEQGLSAEIWVRGGRQDIRPESILGPKMARRAPLPLSS